MRAELTEEIARQLARQPTRRGMFRVLLRGLAAAAGASIVGRAALTAAATTSCDADAPTAASLDAAAAALAAGADEIPLSPGGCVRLRTSVARGLTQTTITLDGLVARRTTQLAGGATVIEEHSALGGPASARISYPPATATP